MNRSSLALLITGPLVVLAVWFVTAAMLHPGPPALGGTIRVSGASSVTDPAASAAPTSPSPTAGTNRLADTTSGHAPPPRDSTAGRSTSPARPTTSAHPTTRHTETIRATRADTTRPAQPGTGTLAAHPTTSDGASSDTGIGGATAVTDASVCPAGGADEEDDDDDDDEPEDDPSDGDPDDDWCED